MSKASPSVDDGVTPGGEGVEVLDTSDQGQEGNGLPAPEHRRTAALALIARYDKSLRRTARRFSLCADDAEDAYQRALEILLRKAPIVEPDRLVRWMHTVTRHEAYAVRRQRSRGQESTVVETEDGEVDAVELVPSDSPQPDEGVEREERIARGREALKSLKPHEVRALALKAEGYSYAEISEMTGWSGTKINRLMVEGRQRFLSVFSDIEEGRRCDQLSDSLAAFSDGEITQSDRPMLLEHLGQCAHCRAKLREYRAVPQTVLSLAPFAALAAPSAFGRTGERVVAGIDRAREAAASVLHRSGAVDASQAVATGGGPRGSGLAILGVVCGIGAAGGGAAVCVDQGVVGDPFGSDPAKQEQQVSDPAAGTAPAVTSPEATPQPAPPQEPEPVPTPAQQREREFGFESSASAASGGGSTEFGGPAASGGSSGGGGGSGASGFGFEK